MFHRKGLVCLQAFISTRQELCLKHQLSNHVETGVAPAWLERKPEATPNLSDNTGHSWFRSEL